MSTTEQKYYTTTDLGESAFLIATGHPLRDVETPGPGPRMVFHFDVKARAAAATYYDGALVPAKPHAHAIRELKALFTRMRKSQPGQLL